MAGPLTVVTTGSNINTTSVQQLITDTTIPFTKLDTQNIVSFQTISVLFDHEPPQPAALDTYTNTLIYSFAHNYSYIPATWMMWQNQSPAFPPIPTTVGQSATTYYPFGDDTAGSAAIGNILLEETIGSTSTCAIVTTTGSNGSGQTTGGYLYTTVDATNVYIYFLKVCSETYGGNVVPLYMAGTTLNIRTYVFTEPATTSTY